MPLEFPIELARRGSVLSGRDRGGFSGGGGRRDDAFVGIVGFVGDQQVGGHLWQQSIGPGQIVHLARGQEKAKRVAEGIDEGVDLGGYSALAAAERLIFIFFGAPAQCWCVRTMALSIIAYSLSASAARCSNTRCHTPSLAHRLAAGVS